MTILVPPTLTEDFKEEKWREAMKEELKAIEKITLGPLFQNSRIEI